MGLRNSVRQQQDSAALSQKLQQALSQELAAQPMQVRCVIRDNTLLVLAEHLLHIEPNREETFSCLESAVRELQPKVGADPSLTAIKSLPVQLFLRIAGYQQPYATHKFKLDLSRSTQPVIQSARAPEPEPLNSSPIASPTAVMQLPVAPPEAPPTVAAAAPIAQAEPEVEAVAAQPEPATLTELIETPALTEQSELQESDQAEAIAAIRVEQQVVQSEPIATPTEPELAINADEFSLIEVETAEPTDESEAIEPEVTELEATELEAIELEAIELEVTEPKVTELEVTEPSTLEPTVAIAAPELTPVELDLVEPSIELDRVEPPVSSDGLAVALSSESTPVELPPTDSIETDSIEIVELIPEPTALFQDATESPAESPAELDRVKPDISDSPEILDSAVVELAPVDLPSVTEEVQSPGELELVIPDGDEQTAIEVEQVEPVEPAAVELDTEATALGLDSPAVINSVQPSTDEVDVTAVVDSDNPQTDESISLEALIAEAALTGVAVEAAQVEHDPVPALEVAGAEPSTESVLNAPDPAAPVSADLAENLDVTVEPEGDLAPDLAAMSAEALVELPPVELPPVEQRPVAQPELADSEISAEELAEGLDPSVLNREGFEPEGLEPEAIAEIISSTLEPDQPQLSVVDLPGQDGTELETEPASGIVEPEIVEGAGLEAVLSAPLAPELPQPEVALEALDPEPLASEELGLEPTAAEQDSLDGKP